MNPQQVIDESLQMLTDVLGQIGLHPQGSAPDLMALRDPFDKWLREQEVSEGDVAFLVSLVGAFICEYLVQHSRGERYVDGRRIRLKMPVESAVLRDFDPYAVAVGIVKESGSLSEFLTQVAA